MPAGAEPEADDLATLYEDVDWVKPETSVMGARTRASIGHHIGRVPFKLALSALPEDPLEVKSELQQWLGPQASILNEGPFT